MAGQPIYAIEILAGLNQSAVVGTAVAVTPLVVVTTVADGLAAPDAPLLWTAGGDSSIGGAPTLRTTSGSSGAGTGLSAASWRMGASAVAFTLSVQIVGQAGTTMQFVAIATVAPPAIVTATSSLSQSATTSTAVSDPPAVQVTDANFNPIAGVAVAWAVTSGGGSINTTGATVTDANGTARLTSWTTGASPGNNTVTATVTGLTGSPVTFAANGTATVPTGIAITAGDGQTGITAGSTGSALQVLVTGAGATPIPNVTVTFAVASGGGSIIATVLTNGAGSASATPTSGATSPRDNAGINTYTASIGLAGGGTAQVTFTLTAVAGAKTKLALQTQPSTNGNSGTLLPGQPVGLIQDVNGNTVTSATDTITATVSSGPGSVTAGGTKAAVAGVWTFTALTITDVTGQNNLLHFASGSLTAVDAASPTLIAPPVPDRILMVTQPANGVTGSSLPACSVRVADASSVTIPGYTGAVTIALSANPGASTLSGTLTVNCVNGVATFSGLSLNNAGAGYTLAFSATGLTGVTSSSFNVNAPGVAFPNEPAWALLAEFTGSTRPPATTSLEGACDVAGIWMFSSGQGNLSVQTDSSESTVAPITSPNILRSRYPVGQAVGVGNTNFQVWSSPGTKPANVVPVQHLYMGIWFNIFGNGTDFEMTAVSIFKPLGFFGVGGSLGSSRNEFYWAATTPGGVLGTFNNFNLQLKQQGVASRSIGGSINVLVNQWYLLEAQMTINTINVADGTCSQFLTPYGGASTAFGSATNILYKNTANPVDFNLWKMNPTYGGSSSLTKARIDDVLFDSCRLRGF